MVCYDHIRIRRWSPNSGRQLPPPKSTHWEGCCSLGAVWSKPHPIPRMQQESDQQIMKQPFMKTCCGLLCVEKFSHAPPWMVETFIIIYNNELNNLSTGAGFRNHSTVCVEKFRFPPFWGSRLLRFFSRASPGSVSWPWWLWRDQSQSQVCGSNNQSTIGQNV